MADRDSILIVLAGGLLGWAFLRSRQSQPLVVQQRVITPGQPVTVAQASSRSAQSVDEGLSIAQRVAKALTGGAGGAVTVPVVASSDVEADARAWLSSHDRNNVGQLSDLIRRYRGYAQAARLPVTYYDQWLLPVLAAVTPATNLALAQKTADNLGPIRPA